jgi:hypothetical protein
MFELDQGILKWGKEEGATRWYHPRVFVRSQSGGISVSSIRDIKFLHFLQDDITIGVYQEDLLYLQINAGPHDPEVMQKADSSELSPSILNMILHVSSQTHKGHTDTPIRHRLRPQNPP